MRTENSSNFAFYFRLYNNLTSPGGQGQKGELVLPCGPTGAGPACGPTGAVGPTGATGPAVLQVLSGATLGHRSCRPQCC